MGCSLVPCKALLVSAYHTLSVTPTTDTPSLCCRHLLLYLHVCMCIPAPSLHSCCTPGRMLLALSACGRASLVQRAQSACPMLATTLKTSGSWL